MMTEEFANRIANNKTTSDIVAAMSSLKDIYDGALAVGFSEEEALKLIAVILMSGGKR